MAVPESGFTGRIALADGTVIRGIGFGAEGVAVGELCFNTAMTGYQEILTDPSYASQIVLFTFPHIGNVGVNTEDCEAAKPVAEGLVVREPPTAPSNWRSEQSLCSWLADHGRVGVAGVDTRRLTRIIRDAGMPHAAVAHDAAGNLNDAELVACARAFAGLEGADLARSVSRDKPRSWEVAAAEDGGGPFRVVALDCGAKRSIATCLAEAGCEGVEMPVESSAEEILERNPDGLLVSNGPGDPAATGSYVAPAIRAALERGVPVFGICLGHQMLARALGAGTVKMRHGHHGANHPVKELESGRVSIVSMNHGFAVDRDTLPDDVEETHVSLFDGSNCGIRSKRYPAFSVQFHPEASPGPRDSLPLFGRFRKMMEDARRAR